MHAADYIGVVENPESTLNSPTASHSFFQNLDDLETTEQGTLSLAPPPEARER